MFFSSYIDILHSKFPQKAQDFERITPAFHLPLGHHLLSSSARGANLPLLLQHSRHGWQGQSRVFQLLQRWMDSPWPTTHGLSVSFRTPAPTGECAYLCPTFLPVLEPSFSTLGINISTPTSLVITCHTSSFNLFVLVFSLKEKQLWMLLKPLRAFSSSRLFLVTTFLLGSHSH